MPHRGPDTKAASTIVKYGDFAFHEQGMPVPFVTMEQEMLNEHNGRWGRIDNITINGVITGQNFSGEGNYASGLIGMQSGLISGFSSDFKNFSIQDSGAASASYSAIDCVVRGISFEESRYNMMVGYSINLQAYQSGYFESYGILDPVDEFSYDEQQEEDIITLVHNVSARGFRASGVEAFDKAKAFVTNRTGLSNKIYPEFVLTGACDNWVLKTQSETLDRINATYSVSETYEMDTGNCDGMIVRYTCGIESGIQDDFVRGSIQGEINGGKTGTMPDVREKFEGLDINNLFVTAASDSHIDFFKIPVTFSSEETSSGTKGDKKISFNASYDNNNIPTGSASFVHNDGPCYFDYNVGVSMDEVTEVTTVNLNGTIRSKGNLQERIANITDFLNDETNGLSNGDNGTGLVRTLARDVFTGVSGDLSIEHDLNVFPNSLSVVTGNKGTASISAAYDNSDRIFDAKIRGSSYNIDVKTALPIYKPRPSVNENGVFAVYDTNIYGREVVNINGQVIPDHRTVSLASDDTVEASGSGVLNTLRTALVSGSTKRMESDTSNRSETDGALSFGNTFSSNTSGIYTKANTKVSLNG